ncbi:MAG: hypothetical protein HY919_07930 [Elusimicrobia bacterium]|nr:hypothetical protein [Elusimicrobiota bacterium]
MALHFRCYNCWESLKYENGNNDYVKCPSCKSELYVGDLEEMFEKSASLENPPEHNKLLEKLLNQLEQNKKIIAGNTEIIAGPDIRHRPDAIFYNSVDSEQIHPIIFEVETFESMETKHSISQCAIFSLTANKTEGEFYLVVPAVFEDEEEKKYSGQEIAKDIMEENSIENVEIITIE